MTDVTPSERVRRGLELAASATVHVEQHLRVPSRGEMESAALTGTIVDGVAQGLALEGGGASLPFWIDEDRGAIDLRAIDPEALQSLDAAVPGVEHGLVSWERSDSQIDRSIRELFRLRLAADPARWLPALRELSPALEDNPEQAGSVMVATRTWRLLELLGLPGGLLGDVVRMMVYDNGFPPDDPIMAHLISDAEPKIEEQPALVAAVFEDDGSIAIIQVVIDLHAWMSIVRPELTIGDSFPIVYWQTYEPTDQVADPVDSAGFPDATDITESLAALTTPDEEIAAMLADLENADSEGGVQVVAGGVRVDPEMRSDLREQSGAMSFVLRDVEPAGAAADALAAMASALRTVAHPDEPDEPLASYMSEAVLIEGGGWFSADISDMEEEGAVIDQLVTVAAAAASRVLDDGELSAKRPDPPADPT